ncbi:MAG: outer membrane beta-barrel protein [Gammaproteobacteria bacterium]|nr:outer membrane beta-barrel protein [Gammaproteobacteria bacterium]
MAIAVNTFPLIVYASSGQFYLGADGGVSIAAIGDQNPQITYYHSQITDAYPLNDTYESAGMIGLNAGYEWQGENLQPTIAIGLGAYGTPGNYSYDGQVTETVVGSPSQSLYNYQFQVSSFRLMAETKLSWNLKYGITPLLDFGIGPAWNHFTDYEETVASSNTNGYVSVPPFQSNTNTNFAYQVGVGLGYSFNIEPSSDHIQHDRLTLEYRYVNLGSNSFNTRGSAYPYALDLGDLNTQEIFLNLTHAF